MAKVLGLHQLLAKRYEYLDLPATIKESFGDVVKNFLMIVYGASGNGKSSLLMQFVKAVMANENGKVLYISLEEGFEASIQKNVLKHLNPTPNPSPKERGIEEDYAGKIEFADYEMTIEKLDAKLSKRKSPQYIVIDSIQYWNISYEQYKWLKQKHPKKSFIFISHSKGKSPDGVTAQKIEYDVSIKVRVEGYVAFVRSRYGGNKPFVIWEDGAKKYWADKYAKVVLGAGEKKKTTKKVKGEKLKVESDELV